MTIFLSKDDKDLMREQGYGYGICVKLPVHPDFEISLACHGEDKDWANWDIRVYRKDTEITFNVFPEPQFFRNGEVPATTDNIKRAIDVCSLIYDSEEEMDVSWILTQYEWGDLSEQWYTVGAVAFTTLQAALLGLSTELSKEYEKEFDPIEWHSGLRFVNNRDDCPSSRETRMWNLIKITKEGR